MSGLASTLCFMYASYHAAPCDSDRLHVHCVFCTLLYTLCACDRLCIESSIDTLCAGAHVCVCVCMFVHVCDPS